MEQLGQGASPSLFSVSSTRPRVSEDENTNLADLLSISMLLDT